MSKDRRARERGVTLVELMIVVVVVAILASIAVPSYRSYLLRAQRTDATSQLLRIRTAQEKFFLQNNAYATAGQMTAAPPAGLGLDAISEHGYYDLTVAIPDPARPGVVSYLATATARGAQVNDQQCQTFTVNDLGTKMAMDGASTNTTATCWR